MQKKPTYCSSPTAVSLILLAATMPFNLSSAQTGGGESSKGSLAQREIIRRTQAVAEADRLVAEGREAYKKADFQLAVDKYKAALGNVRNVPALVDRRESYTQHLADASVALAQSYRKTGKYDEARQLLEVVLAPDMDPENVTAKTELAYLDDPIRTNPALTNDHVKKVDQVRRTLYMAQGYYDLGKYDLAKKEYEDVLRIDPHNEAARRGMEKIAQSKSDYYRAAYGQTRAELLMQVDQAWELSIPADVPTFDPVTTRGPGQTDGVVAINAKLRNIIIPRIDFEDRTVEEAIDYLRLRAGELDVSELDPAKKGVNLVIRRPKSSLGGGLVPAEGELPAGEDLLGGGGDLGAARIDELRLRNVPLGVALTYICDKTNYRYKVRNQVVVLSPIN
ncbi:MAG: tetratricopeptide repeat protein [Akkermansiaceae bacterium]